MNGRCETDPLDRAVDVCDRCFGEFCHRHLLHPPSRAHPLCNECALAASGVRGTTRIELRGARKTVRARRAELRAGAQIAEEEVFRFFDDEYDELDLDESIALSERLGLIEVEPPTDGEGPSTDDEEPSSAGEDRSTKGEMAADFPPPTGSPIDPDGMESAAERLAALEHSPTAEEEPQESDAPEAGSGDDPAQLDGGRDAKPIPAALTRPEPADPDITEPNTVDQDPAEPVRANLAPADPEASDPDPVDSKAPDAEPIEPVASDSETPDSEAIEPESIEPEAIEFDDLKPAPESPPPVEVGETEAEDSEIDNAPDPFDRRAGDTSRRADAIAAPEPLREPGSLPLPNRRSRSSIGGRRANDRPQSTDAAVGQEPLAPAARKASPPTPSPRPAPTAPHGKVRSTAPILSELQPRPPSGNQIDAAAADRPPRRKPVPIPPILRAKGGPETTEPSEEIDTSDRADIDTKGDWIPPILRGMAPDATEAKANLPKRRSATDPGDA